ncbi:hypothetical protein [Kribbella voronezhensis]|nr:hypothetical protein [Kribbella voronezhensis]
MPCPDRIGQGLGGIHHALSQRGIGLSVVESGSLFRLAAAVRYGS